MSMIGHYLRITPRELEALEAAPETVPAFVYREDVPAAGERRLDIDKAWHAIHFLLNHNRDTGHELLNVVFGGETLGDVDLGIGPARAIPVPEVSAMATVVGSVGSDDLRSRWDAQELAENRIYPGIWEDDGALEYVLDHYSRLVQFFVAAARDGDAIITYIA